MSLEDTAAREAAEKDLRESNARLMRQLGQAKAKTEDLVDAVYRAARDAAESLVLPKVPVLLDRKQGGSRKQGETAIAPLADWQLAKVTQDYNSSVCEERVERYGDKLLQLSDIQRADHPVRDLRVYLLGDLVEGELIFPGQSHLIDASLFAQVLVDGPRILGSFLRRMAGRFGSVHVVGVIGNHGSLGGRARRDYHPESNADAMMYETTRLVLNDQPNITWAPNFRKGERNWYAMDEIGDKRFFLFHGDQIKGGFAGFPWYGFGKKLQGWYMKYGPFDYALSGHFHTPVRGFYNGIVHWGSGSTESQNEYAAEQLAASGRPSQWLLFASDKHGVTAEYEVLL